MPPLLLLLRLAIAHVAKRGRSMHAGTHTGAAVLLVIQVPAQRGEHASSALSSIRGSRGALRLERARPGIGGRPSRGCPGAVRSMRGFRLNSRSTPGGSPDASKLLVSCCMKSSSVRRTCAPPQRPLRS